MCNKGRRALRAHRAGNLKASRAIPKWLRGINHSHDRRCLLPLAATEETEQGLKPSGAAWPLRDLQERATLSHRAVDMRVRSTVAGTHSVQGGAAGAVDPAG